MKYIDLSHTLRTGMPVYPETENAEFAFSSTVEKDGFCETLLKFCSHTGTHVDAPAHLFKNGKALDKFELSAFGGTALTIDCTDIEKNGKIKKERLIADFEKFNKAEFIILKTGWERFWNNKAYFEDYPCLDKEAAEYIVKSGKKGVCVDTASVDSVGSSLDIHKILLKSENTVIIENLCNLNSIPNGEYEFFAIPLKFENSDGAPARAFCRFE